MEVGTKKQGDVQQRELFRLRNEVEAQVRGAGPSCLKLLCRAAMDCDVVLSGLDGVVCPWFVPDGGATARGDCEIEGAVELTHGAVGPRVDA